MTGQERGTGLRLTTVMYVITKQYKYYLTNLIYSSGITERYLGRRWIWNTFDKLPKGSEAASAVFAEVDGAHLRYVASGVIIPVWISGEADLRPDPASLRHQSIRSDIRKMEVNQLECCIAKDMESFEDFYYHMYVPHLKKTYGEAAFMLPLSRLRTRFNSGKLLLIRQKAEVIAGLLLTFENNQPYMRHLGVRDGNRRLVKDGAIAAAYEYAFRYLREQGFSKVRLGRSRSFLTDGVLQFKKKRAQRIVSASTDKFVFRALTDTDSIRAFLRNNPFVFEETNNISGIVFVAGGTPLTVKLLRNTYDKYFHVGLWRLIVFFLRERSAEHDLRVLTLELQKLVHAGFYVEALSECDSVQLIRKIGCDGTAIAIYPKVKGSC